MKVLIDFVSMSEDSNLKDIAVNFTTIMPKCEIEYCAKGEHRQYSNGLFSKLVTKHSTLYIRNRDEDYNKTILNMLTTYDRLSDYFRTIEHDTYIDVNFFSNEYFSLEFTPQVLSLLSTHNLTLPISCYKNTDETN